MTKRYFKKKGVQAMEAWSPEYDMSGVSVSDADKANNSPKEGDFIATNPNNPDDKWLVAAKFIEENYEEVPADGFMPRLKAEESQLRERYMTLKNFIDSGGLGKVPKEQRPLLAAQVDVMSAYLTILNERIRIAEEREAVFESAKNAIRA
jgi:hypothetical protein